MAPAPLLVDTNLSFLTVGDKLGKHKHGIEMDHDDRKSNDLKANVDK